MLFSVAGIPIRMSVDGSSFYKIYSGALSSTLPCLHCNDRVSLDANTK